MPPMLRCLRMHKMAKNSGRCIFMTVEILAALQMKTFVAESNVKLSVLEYRLTADE